MKYTVFYCCLLCCTLAMSQEIPEVLGVLQDSVEVSPNSQETYTLYLPSAYEKDSIAPIVFIFDPAARGKAGIMPFIEASEKYNYILICSNNAQNGPYGPNLQIADRLFKSVLPTYAIDEQRIYTAGFSGGSRLAATIAVLSHGIQGVIACGAGFSRNPLYFPTTRNSFSYVGIVGDRDMNYLEMHKTKEWLTNLRLPYELLFFPGEHQWPPSNVLVNAFDWLQLQARNKGLVVINEEDLTTLFQESLTTATQYEEEGNLQRAVVAYERILNNFSDQEGVDSLHKKVKLLKRQKGYKKALSAEKKVAVLEDTLSGKFMKRFSEEVFKGANDDDFDWWRNNIKMIQKKYSTNEQVAFQNMGFRIERQIFAVAIESFSTFLREGKEKEATYAKNLLLVVSPNSPIVHYQLARGYARNNLMSNALEHIEYALQAGWKNTEYLKNTREFAAFKTNPDFIRILNEY